MESFNLRCDMISNLVTKLRTETRLVRRLLQVWCSENYIMHLHFITVYLQNNIKPLHIQWKTLTTECLHFSLLSILLSYYSYICYKFYIIFAIKKSMFQRYTHTHTHGKKVFCIFPHIYHILSP